MKKFIGLFGTLCISLLLVACQSGVEEVAATAVPTQEIAAVTDTPEPTETAVPPTHTPAPTETAVPPTQKPAAANTSTAVAATDTPTKATLTPTPKPPIPTAQPLGDGTELDAMQLVLDSEARARSLETSQFRQNVSVIAPGFEQLMTQNCATELPDRAYCRTDIVFTFGDNDPVTTYNETVQDNEQLWLREEDGPWRDITAEFADSEMFSQEGLQQLILSEFMEEAEVVGETVIDDIPVYEVAFTLDVNTYFASILGEEMAALFTAGAGENSGHGRSWIGQNDMLVRKAFIEMIIVIEGEEMTVTTQVASFGFNEPVTIPDPEAE